VGVEHGAIVRSPQACSQHCWESGSRALLVSYCASALYRCSPSRLPQSIWLLDEMELTLMTRSLTCQHDRVDRLETRWP